MSIEVGHEAPDFELRDSDGQLVKLSDFRGHKNVLLIFYPYAWTRTCTSEFCTLRDENHDLAIDPRVEIFGVSTDSVGSLRAWRKAESYPNRFLADFWPHGAVSQAYGAFDELIGAPVRSTFLIDKEGVVRYVERGKLETLAEARDQAEWRKALDELG
jgi:peroxiredoxin